MQEPGRECWVEEDAKQTERWALPSACLARCMDVRLTLEVCSTSTARILFTVSAAALNSRNAMQDSRRRWLSAAASSRVVNASGGSCAGHETREMKTRRRANNKFTHIFSSGGALSVPVASRGDDS